MKPESNRARQAWADYVALGPDRSLEKLVARYRSVAGSVPTTRLNTLKLWSSQHGWQARLQAIADRAAQDAEAAEAEHRRAIMETGYALDHARVAKLKHLADMLAEELEDPDLRWLKEKRSIIVGQEPVLTTGEDGQERMIGRIPQYETFWLQRPNRAWVEQTRGLLDDIAKEVGGRIQKTELTGKGGGPVAVKVYTDPRMENPLEADWSDAPPPRNAPNP